MTDKDRVIFYLSTGILAFILKQWNWLELTFADMKTRFESNQDRLTGSYPTVNIGSFMRTDLSWTKYGKNCHTNFCKF